jgi:integrase
MPARIHYTDRDLAALNELGEVGLMSTEMIAVRHFNATKESQRKYCQKRLRQFKNAGIVETTALTIHAEKGVRKLPHVHRLTLKRRARRAELPENVCCHTFRATGITAYLDNGGSIANAQRIAAHESPRTTKLYDRTGDEVSLDDIERIVI